MCSINSQWCEEWCEHITEIWSGVEITVHQQEVTWVISGVGGWDHPQRNKLVAFRSGSYLAAPDSRKWIMHARHCGWVGLYQVGAPAALWLHGGDWPGLPDNRKYSLSFIHLEFPRSLPASFIMLGQNCYVLMRLGRQWAARKKERGPENRHPVCDHGGTFNPRTSLLPAINEGTGQ